MDSVLTNSPRLWKGVILLNPTTLPDLSSAPWLQQRPKVLISVGEEEHEVDRLKKYQETALESGVMVEYVIHPGEWHHIVGNAAQLERTKAILHFVFEE
jgi:acetyl esterase/lipase